MNIDKVLQVKVGGEIFKQIPIKGLELYYCSRTGLIYSNSKKKGIMARRKDKDGYLISQFARFKKAIDLKNHRVVAITYIGPCPKGFVCNHINAIKDDNRIENLEWISQKNNYHHSKNMKGRGFYDPKKWTGEKHGHSKLSDQQALEVRLLYKKGFTISKISKKFDVSKSCIGRLTTNKTYKHLL